MLEKLIFNTRLPCKNASHGCKELLVGDERAKHFEVCEFEPVQCPYSCAILPLFSECLFSTNDTKELLEHVTTKHAFDVFENNSNNFQFQLDDITDGSGHYRIILKSPDSLCLLIGFKSQNGSIVLFCRSLSHSTINAHYQIVASFKTTDGKRHRVTWESQMYSQKDEVGLEFNQGCFLKLNKDQVKLWQNDDTDNVPLTVSVGDASLN